MLATLTRPLLGAPLLQARLGLRTFAHSSFEVGTKNPLLLYTFGTPNGRKVSTYLEELKASYPGVDYECVICILPSVRLSLHAFLPTCTVSYP